MGTAEKFILVGNERFYYTELALVENTKKLNLDIAKENLQIFYTIIEQAKINYGLIFGTLLGAIREHNFIAHDYDTDIFILSEEEEKFISLLFDFKNQGFELVRYSNDLISLLRKDEYIDIYIFRPKLKYGVLRLRDLLNKFECEAKFLENPIRFMFLGMNIYIPNNPEKLLRIMYGKNWKTPIENRQASPNTIYQKISRFAPVLEKIPFYASIEKFMKDLLKKFGV